MAVVVMKPAREQEKEPKSYEGPTTKSSRLRLSTALARLIYSPKPAALCTRCANGTWLRSLRDPRGHERCLSLCNEPLNGSKAQRAMACQCSKFQHPHFRPQHRRDQIHVHRPQRLRPQQPPDTCLRGTQQIAHVRICVRICMSMACFHNLPAP